tara:strand:- start:1343 stop:1882 length:540 start_codon:yes stop_codon:yes gene_type:complete
MDNSDCAICGVPLNKEFTHKLKCGHIFHYECLLKSFKTKSKKYSNYSKQNNFCPYCRTPHNSLPIVNGLKKIDIGIHIKPNDFYQDKGLGIIYNINLINLKNEPCKAILMKGKRKGEICGKYCKLGSYYCGAHKKFDIIFNEETNLNKLGDKQELIELEIAKEISEKISNAKEKPSSEV